MPSAGFLFNYILSTFRDVATAGVSTRQSDLEPTTDKNLSSSTQHSSVKNEKITYNLTKFRQVSNEIANFMKIPTNTTRH